MPIKPTKPRRRAIRRGEKSSASEYVVISAPLVVVRVASRHPWQLPLRLLLHLHSILVSTGIAADTAKPKIKIETLARVEPAATKPLAQDRSAAKAPVSWSAVAFHRL
jgi:hypothetical protein